MEGDKLIQILTGNRVIPAYIRARLPTDGRLALRRLEGYEQVQAFYLPQRAVGDGQNVTLHPGRAWEYGTVTTRIQNGRKLGKHFCTFYGSAAATQNTCYL